MPTLSPSRKVRYTAADVNVLTGAITVLEFSQEFDKGINPHEHDVTIAKLRSHAKYIQDQRSGKPQTPAEAK